MSLSYRTSGRVMAMCLIGLLASSCASFSESPQPHPPATSIAQSENEITAPSYWKDIPGWPAFVSVEPGETSSNFTPMVPGANIAILPTGAENWPWDSVSAGTPFVAIGNGFRIDAKLLPKGIQRHGCDGPVEEVTAFSTVSKLSEGPVWIVAPSQRNQITGLSLKAITNTEKLLTWKAGNALVKLEKKAPKLAQLTVHLNGQTMHSSFHDRYTMDGGSDDPIDFKSSNVFNAGIPVLIGAFSLQGQEMPLLVFFSPGFEGEGYFVLGPNHTALREEDWFYAYRCAF